MPTTAQVSNDNEDGVNRVDQSARANDFVPGQVLVKFKDDSSIQVQRTSRGQFRAASVNKVDQLLRSYGVKDMEKLFPAEVAKPKSRLRRKAAPNGTIIEEKNLDKVYWIKTNVQRPDSTLKLIEELKALPEVEYAEPNYKVYITADVPSGYGATSTAQTQSVRRAPVAIETTASVICSNPSSNPLYFRQYGITQQKIQKLWNKPIINNRRPVIAILDTGVDITHPDLVDNIWTNTQEAEGERAYDDDNNGIVDDKYGWNFVDDYGDLTDRNGHGTHVAGIAAAADNNIGIVGANPLALIMPIKVMNDRGVGDDATIARGIAYAAANGADIINMSLGGPRMSNTLKDAIDNAYQTSILVASAGNNGVDIYTNISPLYGTMYPAAYYLVLGVEASGPNLQRATFSNYDPDGPIYSEDGVDGRNYEVQVPGDKIYSTLPDGRYNQLSGTSMSAPLLAGAISALQMVKDCPSKDVLFGDLIHLKANFEDIYSDDTPRLPKIDLVSMLVDDNVEGNTNIDGQVDVGETIKFTPVLRNTWANANDINLQLAVDPNYAGFVDIDNPEVPFGYSLSAYGSSAAQTPITVRFKENIGDNTRIKFTLEVSYAESTESFTQDVYVTVHNMIKISGLITENRTLFANHVYYVNENLGIMEGATLTIEPGTRLEFTEGMGLSSFGKLVAKGTPENPIVFTGHNGAFWAGINSHESTGEVEGGDGGYLYTNADSTLFTLKSTPQTPNKMYFSLSKHVYLKEGVSPKTFYLSDYMEINDDFTAHQDLLTDPNYLTPAILQLLTDWRDFCVQFPTTPTGEFDEARWIGAELRHPWHTYANPRDTISYCKIDGLKNIRAGVPPYMKDCDLVITSAPELFRNFSGERNNISGTTYYSFPSKINFIFSNIVNNDYGDVWSGNIFVPIFSALNYCNYFNNYWKYRGDGKYKNYLYVLGIDTSTPEIDKASKPSYLGTSRESIICPYIYEIGNAPNTYGQIDLSNMPTRPYAEAHGIVWKVVVNGYDAQDEYEQLPPLGVAKHKFEIYFNRPMNKAVAPKISFGVREPYTQHTVDEEGEDSGWNEEGTIYTAYKTITGRTQSDGVNRIYVQGAEDNEYFECPYEKTRFNINIQTAGALATGFAAEEKMGRVELAWTSKDNDFSDAMGFNIYRYTIDGENQTEPVRLNDEVILVKEVVTEDVNSPVVQNYDFTDYNVTPGETYYYYYKVLSTDLQEYDVSNVVAATPLTSVTGDADGSGDVKVGDVISTVNYILGENPKPFIFEAADVNTDQNVDVLDVIGIIQLILNQPSGSRFAIRNMAEAVYTIEDGVLYIETPVTLAGVQAQLSLNEKVEMRNEKLAAAADMKGFEVASTWLTESDYRMLAYSFGSKVLMPGKHAIMTVGDADITSLRLSDTQGNAVVAVPGDATRIADAMGSKVMNTKGVWNLSGQKIGNETNLRKGVYIINGEKIVK